MHSAREREREMKRIKEREVVAAWGREGPSGRCRQASRAPTTMVSVAKSQRQAVQGEIKIRKDETDEGEWVERVVRQKRLFRINVTNRQSILTSPYSTNICDPLIL
jgi:hypothetical protein